MAMRGETLNIPEKRLPNLQTNHGAQQNEAKYKMPFGLRNELGKKATNGTSAETQKRAGRGDFADLSTGIIGFSDNEDGDIMSVLHDERIVDEKGGQLEIMETGISLNISPQALLKPSLVKITVIDDTDIQLPTDGFPIVTPLIKCEPNGLKFEQPAILVLPHCGILKGGDQRVISFSGKTNDGRLTWKHRKEPKSSLTETKCEIEVTHFCRFFCKIKNLEGKRMRALLLTRRRKQGDLRVKLWICNDNEGLFRIIRRKDIQAGFCDVNQWNSLSVYKNLGNVLVQCATHCKEIDFNNIWQGVKGSVSFTLQRSDDAIDEILFAHQKENKETGVEFDITMPFPKTTGRHQSNSQVHAVSENVVSDLSLKPYQNLRKRKHPGDNTGDGPSVSFNPAATRPRNNMSTDTSTKISAKGKITRIEQPGLETLSSDFPGTVNTLPENNQVNDVKRSDIVSDSSLMNELNEVADLWNMHRIRRCRNAIAPNGRPILMYNLPNQFGGTDHLQNVSRQQIRLCKDECTFRGRSPCDETVFDIACTVMAEHNISPPADTREAVEIYKILRRYIRLRL